MSKHVWNTRFKLSDVDKLETEFITLKKRYKLLFFYQLLGAEETDDVHDFVIAYFIVLQFPILLKTEMIENKIFWYLSQLKIALLITDQRLWSGKERDELGVCPNGNCWKQDLLWNEIMKLITGLVATLRLTNSNSSNFSFRSFYVVVVGFSRCGIKVALPYPVCYPVCFQFANVCALLNTLFMCCFNHFEDRRLPRR